MSSLANRMGAILVCFSMQVKNAIHGALSSAWENEDAMATLETVLLIAVLVALALMFKDTIVEFVEGVLDSISSQGGVFDPASIAP